MTNEADIRASHHNLFISVFTNFLTSSDSLLNLKQPKTGDFLFLSPVKEV